MSNLRVVSEHVLSFVRFSDAKSSKEDVGVLRALRRRSFPALPAFSLFQLTQAFQRYPFVNYPYSEGLKTPPSKRFTELSGFVTHTDKVLNDDLMDKFASSQHIDSLSVVCQ